MGMDMSSLMKLGSSFGGGMSRLREVCGTCSAMFLIAGWLYGYDCPDTQAKSRHYAFIQSLAADFRKANGSIVCRELLASRAGSHGSVDNGTAPEANERTEAYYRSRPCLGLIEYTTDLICQRLGISDECGDAEP